MLTQYPNPGERLGKEGIAVRELLVKGSRSTPGTAGTPTSCANASTAECRGYLVRDAEPEAIVRSIAAVHDGQVILSPAVGAQLIAAGTAAPAEDRPFPSLTPREREILDRLSRGLRNEAIATRMGISVKTVQNSVSGILLKLGAVDRAQAVPMARDAGLGTRSPESQTSSPVPFSAMSELGNRSRLHAEGDALVIQLCRALRAQAPSAGS